MYNLKKRRKEKGLTGEALGKLVNVQRAAISKYERGEIQPSQDILVNLARVLDCSTDFLLGLSDIPMPFPSKKNNNRPQIGSVENLMGDSHMNKRLVTLKQVSRGLYHCMKDVFKEVAADGLPDYVKTLVVDEEKLRHISEQVGINMEDLFTFASIGLSGKGDEKDFPTAKQFRRLTIVIGERGNFFIEDLQYRLDLEETAMQSEEEPQIALHDKRLIAELLERNAEQSIIVEEVKTLKESNNQINAKLNGVIDVMHDLQSGLSAISKSTNDLEKSATKKDIETVIGNMQNAIKKVIGEVA